MNFGDNTSRRFGHVRRDSKCKQIGEHDNQFKLLKMHEETKINELN